MNISSLDKLRSSGHNLEKLGLSDKTLKKIIDASNLGSRHMYKDSGGIVPQTIDELIKTPFYRMYPISVTLIQTFLSKHAVNGSKEIVNGLNNFVHFSPYIRCGYILSEALAEIGCEIGGCDIDKSGIPSFRNGIRGMLTRRRAEKAIHAWVEQNNERREKEMGRRIADYASRRKKDNPILAIVGRGHLEDTSFIYPELDAAGIKYTAILPTLRELPTKEHINFYKSTLTV